MALLDALQSEIKNRKVSNELWRQDVSQPWAGGTANSKTLYHRHQALGHPEPGKWTLDQGAPAEQEQGGKGPQDIFSPCRGLLPNQTAFLPVQAAWPQDHQGSSKLLCSSTGEKQLKVLQSNSAGTGISRAHQASWNLNTGFSHIQMSTVLLEIEMPTPPPQLPSFSAWDPRWEEISLKTLSHRPPQNKEATEHLSRLQHKLDSSCLPRNRCLSQNPSGIIRRAASHRCEHSSAVLPQEIWGAAVWG